MTSNGSLYEAVLKQAVIQDYMRELNTIPSEQELGRILSYSPSHIARMNKLFADDTHQQISH